MPRVGRDQIGPNEEVRRGGSQDSTGRPRRRRPRRIGCARRWRTPAPDIELVNALSGPRALGMMAQAVPAVLVVDAELAGVDGYAFTRQVKTAPGDRTGARHHRVARSQRGLGAQGATGRRRRRICRRPVRVGPACRPRSSRSLATVAAGGGSGGRDRASRRPFRRSAPSVPAASAPPHGAPSASAPVARAELRRVPSRVPAATSHAPSSRAAWRVRSRRREPAVSVRRVGASGWRRAAHRRPAAADARARRLGPAHHRRQPSGHPPARRDGARREHARRCRRATRMEMILGAALRGAAPPLRDRTRARLRLQHPGVSRFRANVFQQRNSMGAVFRVIPHRDPDDGGPRPAQGVHVPRRAAPRARAGHRSDRLGQVDDARRDGRPHQRDAAAATSSRWRTPSSSCTATRSAYVNQREVGEDTHSFAVGAQARPAPGPRRHPRRRDARPRDDLARRSPRPRRATWCSRRCTPPAVRRRSTASSTCSRRTSSSRCACSCPTRSRACCRRCCCAAPTARAA